MRLARRSRRRRRRRIPAGYSRRTRPCLTPVSTQLDDFAVAAGVIAVTVTRRGLDHLVVEVLIAVLQSQEYGLATVVTRVVALTACDVARVNRDAAESHRIGQRDIGARQQARRRTDRFPGTTPEPSDDAREFDCCRASDHGRNDRNLVAQYRGRLAVAVFE